MPKIIGINESQIKQIMRDTEIQFVSIASGTKKDNIVSRNIPNEELNDNDNKEKTDDPVYGVASLMT